MITIDQAKVMAKRLRTAVAPEQALTHSAALELVAAQLGFSDWNAAVAGLDPGHREAVKIEGAIPILRIFDEAKTREFYCGFLGFEVEFEHRFEAGLPLYVGVSRSGLTLHLSEHHGDATPGSTAFVPMTGLSVFHAELTAKSYGFGRPGIEREAWGDVLEINDPFGNRLRFCEYRDA